MANAIEHIIRQKLSQESSSEYFFETQSLEELRSLSELLFRKGDLSKLGLLWLRALENNESLVWGKIAEEWIRSGASNSAFQYLIEGCKEQKLELELACFSQSERTPQALKVFCKSQMESYPQFLNQLKVDHLARAEFFRNDRLLDEEIKTLRHLQLLFPEDNGIKKLLDEAAQREAHSILEGKKRSSTSVRATPAQSESPSEMTKNLVLAAQGNASFSTDLALACLQMGDYEAANQCWEVSSLEPHSLWLGVEIKFELRHYVEVLSLLDRIEATESANADQQASIAYERARALWGLNQKNSAIQIMEEIARINPAYRSAVALLLQWKDTQS